MLSLAILFTIFFGSKGENKMNHHPVIPVVIALALVCADAVAQTKAISLAYQVSHVDQASPAVSPGGNKIVYATSIAGKEQLFIMKLDGSESVQSPMIPVTTTIPCGLQMVAKLSMLRTRAAASRSTLWT